MDGELAVKTLFEQYKSMGNDRFYRFLLGQAMLKMPAILDHSYKGNFPNLELLSIYEKLVIMYRRTGENDYLIMAKTFRRAGHKIYRLMLKVGITDRNQKFLNVV